MLLLASHEWHILLKKLLERLEELSQIQNESVHIIDPTHEAFYLFTSHGGCHILDDLGFSRVEVNSFFVHSEPQRKEVQLEVVLLSSSEDFPQTIYVVTNFLRLHKNVIAIVSEAIREHILENGSGCAFVGDTSILETK